MINLNGFNAEEVIEETADLGDYGDFELLPVGDYLVMMTEAKMKDTRSGTGKYINATFMIVDGKYEGRKLWDIFNWENENKKAVDIGKRQFATLCRACGNNAPDEIEDLFNIEVVVRVGINPAKGQYKESNKIKSYRKPNSTKKTETKPVYATETKKKSWQ